MNKNKNKIKAIQTCLSTCNKFILTDIFCGDRVSEHNQMYNDSYTNKNGISQSTNLFMY